MTRQFDTFRCYIELYQQLGYNLIPIKYGTKKPLVPWKEYQKRKSTFAEIEQWFFGRLTKTGFHLQFCVFMIHYFKHKLREKWFDKTSKKWLSETVETLYQEPWCYKEWHEFFPTSSQEFLELLVSEDFNNFVESHVKQGFTWGWTKLFNKDNPMLLNLLVRCIMAQSDTKQLKEALKTCKILFDETRTSWLRSYPKEFGVEVIKEFSVGDILFQWVVSKEKRSDKLTAMDIAGILKLNLVTCRRTVMPTLNQLKPLLAPLGIQIAGRGEG